MVRKVLILFFFLAYLITGCLNTSTLYVCHTGEQVSDPSLCPKSTSTPQKTEPSLSSATVPPTEPPKTTTLPGTTLPPETTQPPTTVPPITLPPPTAPPSTQPPASEPLSEPIIVLEWNFTDNTPLYMGENEVESVSVSSDGKYYNAFFKTGKNYIFDSSGEILFSSNFEGNINYALYRRDVLAGGGELIFTGPYKFFKKLSENKYLLVFDSMEIKTIKNIPISKYTPVAEHTDRLVYIDKVDVSSDSTFAVVTSSDDLSLRMLKIFDDSFSELWRYKTRGFAFFEVAISSIPTVVATQTDGWIALLNSEGNILWNENLNTQLISVDISSGGGCIIAADDKWNLYFLDNQGNIILKKLFQGNLKDVAISPDCSYFIVGVDDRLEKYKIDTGTQINGPKQYKA